MSRDVTSTATSSHIATTPIATARGFHAEANGTSRSARPNET